MNAPMDTPWQHVDVPGARIAYTVRGDLGAATPERPPLLVFGSPMDSSGLSTVGSCHDRDPSGHWSAPGGRARGGAR